MSRPSPADVLVLHAVRLLGVASDDAVAARFALDPAAAKELLLDYQAFGWISWSEFAGTGGWSLTAAGRTENERRLAAELDTAGAGRTVRAAYQEFLPLNARLQVACTRWQLRPTADDPLAFNDHTDHAWDQQVLDDLARLADELEPLAARLAAVLGRFGGYHTRFAAALSRARAGDVDWVDRTTVDSCHRTWFELHEDLIATLNVDRGTEP